MDFNASAEAARSLGKESSDRPSGGEVRTFLIADVRGYTRFTQEEGDDEAAALAKRFAGLVRNAVAGRDGEVIELRGDEALAVFASARQALRAAVDMQRRARADSEDRAAFPLGIGVGVDAGEAVPLEGGYRGGALNLASRLCSLAKPGEILVSDTVVGLARRVEGIRFVKRRPVRLKGLAEPVPLIEAAPDPPLPPLTVPPRRRRSVIRRHKWPLLTATAVVTALTVALSLTLRPRPTRSAIPRTVVSVPRSFSGLVRIDPRNNKVVKQLPIPGQHLAAFANGSLWITEPYGVDKVNPRTGQVLARIPITGTTPNLGLGASTREGIWVANPEFEPFTLSEINPYRETVSQRLRLPGRPTAGPYVGEGFVWLVVGANTIFKIDPANGKVASRIPYSFPQAATAGAAATGEGALWIADPHGVAPGEDLNFGVVVRVDARTNKITQIPVPRANGVAVGGGAIWARSGTDAGNPGTGDVTEINPGTNRVIQTVHLGRADWITAGHDAVWVQNDMTHTAVRINPATGDVVARLILPRTTKAIGELGDSLWVGVWP